MQSDKMARIVFIIWPFENVPYSIKMMYKVGSKYCQILSNLSKIAKRFLKCCHPNDL